MESAAQDPGSDHVLASRVASGDRTALGLLFERHRGRLLLLVRQRLGPALRRRLESEDVLQVAFLDAVRDYAASTKPEDAFLPWIATVIERTIRDQARWFGRKRRATDREGRTSGLSSVIADPGAPSPSRVLALSEDLAHLDRALDRLKKRDRELILLSRVEGRSTAEIAVLLGKSPEAAKRALTRAVARLAVEMAD